MAIPQTTMGRLNHHPVKLLIKTLAYRIGVRTLTESLFMAAGAALTALFVTHPAGIAILVITGVVLVIFNLATRVSVAFAILIYNQIPAQRYPELKKCFEWAIRIGHYVAPMGFALYQTGSSGIVLHEAGHALMASLVYQDPHIRMRVEPFVSGVTWYRAWPLTALGERLGYEWADACVSAAGSGVEMLAVVGLLAASYGTRESRPELSRYLFCTSVQIVIQVAQYALSALWSHKPGHDFAALALAGMHPAAAISLTLAVPIITRLGIGLYDYCEARPLVDFHIDTERVLTLREV